MRHNLHTGLLSSPFEAGVRPFAILVAVFPEAYNLQWLVGMDYLIVHSGDVDDSASLHAPLPMRVDKLLIKHGLIEKRLLLMISRGLVQRVTARDGFRYQAGEVAAPFMASLTTEYSYRLRGCAEWAVVQFNDLTIQEIRDITRRFFQQWSSQFQNIQSSGG